jgi:hypothetical protein
MSTSKTIAALLGPTLVVTALALLVNFETASLIIGELSHSPAVIMIAGYITFVPGLAIIYFHNKWDRNWSLLITLFGWVALVAGLIRILFPTQLAAMMEKIAPHAGSLFPMVALIMLLIGGFLSLKAYAKK